MDLTSEQQAMLDGKMGRSLQKSMQILAGLGEIYQAERLAPVASVQIAGVSYDNLGEAGLEFLCEMADGGGKARVLTTLNPAGMDVDHWEKMGIDREFASRQQRVIDAFASMGVIPTCSCTPYLIGSLPHYGQHIAWAESSAVCYANSVLGARTNREGGPSALASALTGLTPACGYHLDENRVPSVTVQVDAEVTGSSAFGVLGVAIGRRLEASGLRPVPYLRGIPAATLEELKSFCASLATYGGSALFHMEGITPEAVQHTPPELVWTVTQAELQAAASLLYDSDGGEPDFISLGCPHLSLQEVAHLADLLRGKKVRRTFWVTVSRPVRMMADRLGYSQTIEASGAIIAADTCCVVAPIKGRFRMLVTDSAKACYYAASKNRFKTRILPFDQVVAEALR